MPTATASAAARSSCTRRRDSSPVTQRRSGTVTRPSSVTAALYVTNGRPSVAHVRQASFWRRASTRSSSTASTPASRSRSSPPPAVGVGSRQPATTRAMPAASTASTHGGVRPWCAHGSIVTKSVAPPALSPAASRATTSPWRPPSASVTPSPTTSSVANDHRADGRVGVGDPEGGGGEAEGALEAHPAAATSSR